MQSKDNNFLITTNASCPHIQLNMVPEDLVSKVFDYNSPENCRENILVWRGECPVVACGEITVVTGPRKSFKSHICAAIAASAIGSEPQNCLNFASKTGLKVLYVDTEQSYASTAGFCKLITRDGDPSKFIPYNWRLASQDTRAAALELAIQTHHPDVVIIDGIVDLIKNSDFNNIIDSSKLVDELVKTAQEFQCGIVTVIHLNPFSSKERGSLGTILCNKAYGYIGMTKNKKFVTVSSADSARTKPLDEFVVAFDETLGTIREVDARACPCNVSIPAETRTLKNDSSITRPLSENVKARLDTIKGLFSIEHPDYSFTELSTALMRIHNIKDANRTIASSAITLAVENGIIIKGEGRRGRYRLVDDLPE